MIPGRDSLVNFYTTSGFDRATQYRDDQQWLSERLSDPGTQIHIVWRGRTLVGIGETRIRSLALADHKFLIEEARAVVLLGVENDSAHVAIDLSHQSEEWIASYGRAVDLRSIGAVLPARDGALAAFARGMVHWHSRHLYCGACGSPTKSEKAGHVRRCTNQECGSENFPRIDPAVIMRVTHDERILLGRQAEWPAGMHSVLAGFVEPGESLEDAVRRETMEEAGLTLSRVEYFGSQPWPFPSSLMVGFIAESPDDRLNPDRKEIDVARWFTREELLNSPEDESFRLPRRDSIARRLVDDWLERS